MCPGEETELSHVVPLDERQDEPHEAHAVQTERDEPMVRHQELQVVLLKKLVISVMFSVLDVGWYWLMITSEQLLLWLDNQLLHSICILETTLCVIQNSF